MKDEINHTIKPRGLWLVFGVAVIAGVLTGGGISYILSMPAESEEGGSNTGYRSSAERFRQVEERRVGYVQTKEFDIDLPGISALAVGRDNNIYVAGEGHLVRITPEGKRQRFALQKQEDVKCLAVGGGGDRIYVGLRNAVLLYTAKGELMERWTPFNDKAHLTGVAAGDNIVYAADAGNKEVLQLSHKGKVRRTIDGPGEKANHAGFVIPSLYFDVAVAASGAVWITNPGKHTLEKYTKEGEFVRGWGKTAAELEGFSGCCNPVYIGTMPDDGFVTSEKGINRVKIYTSEGDLRNVVIPPSDYAEDSGPYDIAVDSKGRILALDKARGMIRVYEMKSDALKGD